MKKDILVKITVNNSGLCFEDDVNTVILTIPDEEDVCTVYQNIMNVDKELHEEDDSGDCEYSRRGYNYTTLMEELELRYGYTYRDLSTDIDFTID